MKIGLVGAPLDPLLELSGNHFRGIAGNVFQQLLESLQPDLIAAAQQARRGLEDALDCPLPVDVLEKGAADVPALVDPEHRVRVLVEEIVKPKVVVDVGIGHQVADQHLRFWIDAS